MPRLIDYFRAIPHLWRNRGAVAGAIGRTMFSRGYVGRYLGASSAMASTSRRGRGVSYLSGRRFRRRLRSRRVGRRGRPARMRRTLRRSRMYRLRGIPHAPKAMYERRTKVSSNEALTIPSGYNADLYLNISASMLTYWPGTSANTGVCVVPPLNNAFVPYFWRQIDQWKTFGVSGMKLRLLAYPKHNVQHDVTAGTSSYLFKYEDAYSVTGEVNAGVGVYWNSNSFNSPTLQYTCKRLAQEDPTFKGATFTEANTMGHMPKKKRTVFSRYYPMTSWATVHEGPNSVRHCGTGTPPALVMSQRDSFIQYVVDALVYQTNGGEWHTHDYQIRRTWYFHLYGRKVEHSEMWPAWQRPQCTPAIGVGVGGSSCPAPYPNPDCDPPALPPCSEVCEPDIPP